MPVDIGAVDDIAHTVAAVYAEAELALLRMITRRLSVGVEQSDWATQRLAEIGAMRRAAAVIVAQLYQDGDAALRRGVAAAYRAGNDQAVADLADAHSPHLAQAARIVAHRRGNPIQALADAAVAELRPAHESILPQAIDTYRRAIAGATARALAGGQTRRQAAQAAWAALVDRGITGYTTQGGRRLRLHTYVEMATRTAVTRAVSQGVIDEGTAAGQRLVYVTDTAGECALCRPWEHKVLALWGDVGDLAVPHARFHRSARIHVAATLAQAREAGLQHPNCRHQIRLYVPGVTTLTARTADPQGDTDRRNQRAIERQLRGWREQAAAAITTEGRAAALDRVAAWDQAMAQHIARTGLARQRLREFPGAGHEAPPARRGDRANLPRPGRGRGAIR